MIFRTHLRIRGLSTCPNHPRTAKPQRKPDRFDTERSKEGAFSRWSSSLYCPVRNSNGIAIEKTHRLYSCYGMTVACEITLITDWHILGDLLVSAALLKTTLSVLVSQVIQIQNYHNGVMDYCAIVRVIALLRETESSFPHKHTVY